jgi:hypothetical protein
MMVRNRKVTMPVAIREAKIVWEGPPMRAGDTTAAGGVKVDLRSELA